MVDFEAIKQRQQETWASGDFSRVGAVSVLVGERLCDAVRLHAKETVLDVATGSGNAALAAARRRGQVTGVDYVPALLDHARSRAAVEQLPVDFVEGDAENLPFPDGAFDCVVSTFGSMFAPNQEKAASELLRVCRRGGRVGLACWTPESFLGRMFRTVSQHVRPADGLKPPSRWGTNDGLRELFGAQVTIDAEPRTVWFRGDSPEAFLDFFRRFFGPVLKAFESLGPPDQAKLRGDLLALVNGLNESGDDTVFFPVVYLEVVIHKP